MGTDNSTHQHQRLSEEASTPQLHQLFPDNSTLQSQRLTDNSTHQHQRLPEEASTPHSALLDRPQLPTHAEPPSTHQHQRLTDNSTHQHQRLTDNSTHQHQRLSEEASTPQLHQLFPDISTLQS